MTLTDVRRQNYLVHMAIFIAVMSNMLHQKTVEYLNDRMTFKMLLKYQPRCSSMEHMMQGLEFTMIMFLSCAILRYYHCL